MIQLIGMISKIMVLSGARKWTPNQWVEFYTSILTMGPCAHPCDCVVDAARAGLRADAPAVVVELHDALERVLKAVAACTEAGHQMIAEQLVEAAERYANGGDRP